jgi:cell wall-associated NlpC family hydrolase
MGSKMMLALVVAAVLFLPLEAEAAVTATQGSLVGQSRSSRGDAVVAVALQYQGVPYVFGGTTPRGFDCSGYVQFVFQKFSVKLPRSADLQFETGKAVGSNQLQPGDVVFFTTYEKGASHCGIYVGQGKFVHASSSQGVMVSSLADKYWLGRYLGARRMF